MADIRAKLLLALALALCGLEVRAAEGAAAPIEAPIAFPRTVPEGVPSLQMSTDLLSPGFAIGVYGPMGEVASRGVRVAPFTFRGWMHAGMGYDDNVALSSANKRGSMFLTLHPALSIGLEGQSHRYFGVYRGGYAQYFSASSSNYENHNLTLQASDDWSTRLRTAFHYDYLRAQDPVGATGVSLRISDPWSRHGVRGTVSYGADGSLARVSGSLGYVQRRYLERPADTRNYERVDVLGTFSYRVAPNS